MVPPVKIAISSSIALRRSPKPGAFTATTLRCLRSLFCHYSRIGHIFGNQQNRTTCAVLPAMARSPAHERFLSWIRMYGFSYSVVISSAFVTASMVTSNHGQIACPILPAMQVSVPFASSTVMTPSLDTRFIRIGDQFTDLFIAVS